MKVKGGGTVAGRAMAALLTALSAIVLSAPGQALALDSDLKHSAAFKLSASNGYSIVAIANSERLDGRGEIFLIVYRGDAVATYLAPATLSATRVESDLGGLGNVSLEVVPSGREKTIRSRCGGEPERLSFEPRAYRGAFEFHGEEGYTEAATASPREYTRFFLDLFCGGGGGGELIGHGLPGARLRVGLGSGHHRLGLQINENRPGARAVYEVEVAEKRHGVEITRTVLGRAPSGVFDYDPLLRAATLDPPAPFSGRATFYRNAAPARHWAGNLAVDLPGRSDVSLTGAGVRATLVPARLESS